MNNKMVINNVSYEGWQRWFYDNSDGYNEALLNTKARAED